MKKKEKDAETSSAKEFDAVKMMRDIRDKLSEKYYYHPDIMFSDLAKIRKKYKLNSPHKKVA